ncbi:hypothetical protein DLAC_00801 [Tieghemostelium lacteum]|uniref:J domain-containing protein n=1 Tax=Tieghemostelium lacteum TaxID=361077 RepID=A0A152A6Z2_TIELA|nr:hypothetical protein DLAC_00801 [Tieghemostelium lacteum]|eukprot:KYR02008.1 hypothetical protein DLAC_00801 [Tieghemostelium lacteum]
MSNSSEIENWYQVLLIEEDATENQIQVAYRKLAKKYHPDKNKSEEAVVMFEKISKAQQTLLNQEKRSFLDSQLKLVRDRLAKDAAMDENRKRMKVDLQDREDKFKKRKEQDDRMKKNVEFQNMKFKEDFIKELYSHTPIPKKSNIKQQQQPQDNTISIKWRGKLNYTIDHLNDIFTSFGTVESISVIERSTTESKYSMALVTFSSLDSKQSMLSNIKDLKKKFKIKLVVDQATNGGNSSGNSGVDKSHLYREEIVNIVSNIPNTSPTTNDNITLNQDEEDDILNQMMNFKKK